MLYVFIESLVERYRCPEEFASFAIVSEVLPDSGYFRFGQEAICYGPAAHGWLGKFPSEPLPDLSEYVRCSDGTVYLPFDAAQVIDDLRMERYARTGFEGDRPVLSSNVVRKAYYSLRPLLDVPVRKHIQRRFFRGWEDLAFPAWPVDRSVDHLLEKLLFVSMKARGIEQVPFIWFWPEGCQSCAMVTHDVETETGAGFASRVMDVDDAVGIKSSFQIIPELQYPVSATFLDEIRSRGFELNVQDLRHDGNLFGDYESFLSCAQSINRYLRDYDARGFRAGRMYRNAEWIEALNIDYDMSFPNVAHLEPQRGGCCTVFPYFIGNILELPLTTTQDYSLFHILGSYSTELWMKQIELITQSHGLVSVVVHPDYIMEQQAMGTYTSLLAQLTMLRDESGAWVTLPGEVNRWWRERRQMKLVQTGNTYRIEGAGSERARLAYAKLDGDRIVYSLSSRKEGCVSM